MIIPEFSGLIWRPLFEYTDCDIPISFELGIPQRDWVYGSTGDGGHDISTSGVDETFVVRHDRTLTLRLRMTEGEYIDDFEPMIRTLWAQGQEFTVQLDANDPTTAKLVRLVSPWITDGLSPTAHEFMGVLEVEITVRSADGSAFPRRYFPQFAEDA